MKNFSNNNLKNLDSWFFLLYNLIITSPIFEVIFSICCICIKILFLLNVNDYLFFIHHIALHDTGNMFALLLYLEHMFISYYLIVIIIMVYRALFMFIKDFTGWSLNYNSIIYNFIYNFEIINYLESQLLVKDFFYNFYYLFFKNFEMLLYIYIYNYVLDENISKYEYIYNSYFNKYTFLFNLKYFDILGRHTFILNKNLLELILKFNIMYEYWCLIDDIMDRHDYRSNIKLEKQISTILFYRNPDIYYYSNNNNINFYFKKTNYIELNYSYMINNLRFFYKDMFLINQFRHSGIFEAIWAIIPSRIILAILIPSLILLYSFENTVNPGITVKVMGNQWYWKYEFNNYFNILNEDIDMNNNYNERIITNFCFDSKIINTPDLDLENKRAKRLLEVDNRLCLPTNVTIRFLVSSTDVLHSFAVPGLGFKIDANPGRLNQIITYINRPGVYYGQCSELCGANHGFMPIVIDSIHPKEYNKYLKELLKMQGIIKDAKNNKFCINE